MDGFGVVHVQVFLWVSAIVRRQGGGHAGEEEESRRLGRDAEPEGVDHVADHFGRTSPAMDAHDLEQREAVRGGEQ